MEKLLYSIGKSFTILTFLFIREGAMSAKRISQSIVIVAILAALFASAGSAFAWSGCASYITVQWGDTWNSIAAACGTTVEAIQAANPGLGWWLYAGQVLYIPAGYTSAPAYYPAQAGGSTYVVQWGDTLGGIAMMYGVSLSDILSVNPQIWNANLIYPGQVIYLPASAYYASNYYPSNPNPTYTYPSNPNPSNYYPPTPYPSTPYPTTNYNTPYYSSGFSNLRVTYGHGLLVRTGPGINYSEIKSPLVSAVKNSRWQYRDGSLTIDSTGFAWVEVTLSQTVNGYSTGWILVRDSLGNYFTDPNLGPPIDPNDP
jgi:LysM repeat protein